jgi:hypothetical protein
MSARTKAGGVGQDNVAYRQVLHGGAHFHNLCSAFIATNKGQRRFYRVRPYRERGIHVSYCLWGWGKAPWRLRRLQGLKPAMRPLAPFNLIEVSLNRVAMPQESPTGVRKALVLSVKKRGVERRKKPPS